MQEGQTSEARECRDRALGAIAGADRDTAVALWKAALRFNKRMKLEAAGRLEIEADRLPRAFDGWGRPGREIELF